MTDYKEEQSNEIEALESIYPEELEILATEPFHEFQFLLKADYTEWQMEETYVECTMKLTYTEKYPDEAPVVELLDPSDNLDGLYLNQLNDLITEQIEENLGMVMAFTLVSAFQEKLADLAETIAKEAKAEVERKIQEAEEVERKRFEGTCVTIETFLKWKESFDAELAEKRRMMGLSNKVNKKPTGKELFMTDDTFDDSDMAFLEDEVEAPVTVDESLFQDMDDLDLDDELDLES